MANEKIKYIKFKPPGQQAEQTYDIHVDVANVDGLLSGGKIASGYLPSYVDDIIEYDNKSAFPVTGEAGKIYIDKSDENRAYRWSGSVYIEIVDMPDLTQYYTKTEVDSAIASAWADVVMAEDVKFPVT